MTSNDPHVSRQSMSASRPRWSRFLGTTFGIIVFACGIFFWIISLQGFISKSHGATIALEETQAFSVVALVIYAVVTAGGLLLVGAVNGATHLSVRIGFAVYVLLLLAGIVVNVI